MASRQDRALPSDSLKSYARIQKARTALRGAAVCVDVANTLRANLSRALTGIELALSSATQRAAGISSSRAGLTIEIVAITRLAAVDRAISAQFESIPENDVRRIRRGDAGETCIVRGCELQLPL
jgi:hypothetical protein